MVRAAPPLRLVSVATNPAQAQESTRPSVAVFVALRRAFAVAVFGPVYWPCDR
jgi:hypothetical protein